MSAGCFIPLLAGLGCMAVAANANFPARISDVDVTEKGCTDDSTIIQAGKKLVIDTVASQLNERYGPPCLCRGAGASWSQFYSMNGSSLSWNTCSPDSNGNGSVPCEMLTSIRIPNSHRSVCGRIKAFQRDVKQNQSYAFNNYLYNGHNTVSKPYVTGVSITYNSEHVWTFVVPQPSSNESYTPDQNCDCSNSSDYWSDMYQYPDFLGSNFFCDSNNKNGTLWSGQGCSPDSSCCDPTRRDQAQQPPWFCTTLSTSGSNSLEIKHFGDAADIDSIELYSST